MPFSIYQAVPLLSSVHIMGSAPSTDVEAFSKDGIFTDEVFWKSRIDVGFPAEFDSFSMQSNFKAGAVSGSAPNDLYCGTAVNVATGSGRNWASISNAEDNTPGTYAYCVVYNNPGDYGDYAKVTDFGFNVPGGVTIAGIKVTAKVSVTPSDGAGVVKDYSVRLVKAGTIVGNDYADSVEWYQNNAKAWGGATDLWGTTWTAAELNASGFGVAISPQCYSGVNSSAFLYTVQIHIYYTNTLSMKWQIKPNGEAWEDIPGSDQSVIISDTLEEYPLKILKNGTDFDNNDLPADIQLLFTGSGQIGVEVGTLHNSVGIIGNSVAGTATKYPFDWSQYILSSVLDLGATSDDLTLAIDNPSDQVAYVGYVDPGFPGTITDLEMNTKVTASVNTVLQVTTLKWQIRPVGETVWKDVVNETVTLTAAPIVQGNFHVDLVAGDFTGWTSGLKGPFEFRLVFSATGTGATFYFKTYPNNNYCRLIGTVD